MNRSQLEHVILEIGERTGLEYFYIVGAAAVAAQIPEAFHDRLVQTRDIDVVPGLEDPLAEAAMADRLDWVLGEGSDFELEHQYYVQGLDRTTPAYAPQDWMMRAVSLRVGAYTGLCMEIHDVALSKFGAGRPKDLDFNRALAAEGLIDSSVLLERLGKVSADSEIINRIKQRIAAAFGQS